MRARQSVGKPQVILAMTVPGKGVSFMEGDYTWHGKPPNAQQADEALRELAAQRESILARG
jgi:transketolase